MRYHVDFRQKGVYSEQHFIPYKNYFTQTVFVCPWQLLASFDINLSEYKKTTRPRGLVVPDPNGNPPMAYQVLAKDLFIIFGILFQNSNYV